MHDRVFHALLRLLPEELRAAYGREMEATFRAERRDAAGRGRRLVLTRLWLATLGDLLRHVPAQHGEVCVRDVRYALRIMWRARLHAGAAILALALAIGANVAMFAVVDAVLFAPLPYPDPGRAVIVQEQARGREPGNVGYLTFLDLRARARSFRALAAAAQSFATVTGDGADPERLHAMRVSSSYFEVVGVKPALGRAFTAAEDRPGDARRVAILSDRLWRRRFKSDASVIGRPIALNGVPSVVVGVMPPAFDDLVAERLFEGAELWTPLGYDPAADFACRTCRHLCAFGRLATGVDARRAEREASGILRQLAIEHGADYDEPSARVRPLAEFFLGPARPVLLVLWAGVVLLLLVACANVANLLLMRASQRGEEMAIRAALGVTRGRLARQLATEALVLAAAGGAAGLLPAWLAIRFVALAGPAQLPRLASVAFDGRVFVAACLLTAASAVGFGLLPLRQLTSAAVSVSMLGAGRRTASVRTGRVRALLAGATIAIAAVLLVGAGLLVRSLMGLLAVTPGFEPARVLTANVDLAGARYQAQRPADQVALVARFYDAVVSRLRAQPEVEAASAVSTLPLGGGVDQFSLHVAGRPVANPEAAPVAHRFAVQSRFFDALRIPLLRGRIFDDRDGQAEPLVAVINRGAAETLFPGEDPLGHRIMLGPPSAPARTIVGVVGDIRHQGLDVPPGLQVYVPQAQWVWAEGRMTLIARARGDAAALAGTVRRVVHDVDPLQPVSEIQPYDAVVARSVGARRFASWLLVAFAGTAGVLALVGLYGAIGVMVGLRRREIGVRLALGAGRARVRGMVVAQGMRPAAAGVAAGLGAAWLTTSSLRSLVFAVDTHDPATFIVAAVLLLLAALVACAIPAWRAGRVDPATTLKAE